MYDITERRRAEEALRESHDRFKATIASLDEAVFLVDPATRLIIECNDATTRIFGYSYEELVGRGTGFLHVDPAHLEQFGREASATYENPGYYRREFHMRRKDGGVFPTEHFVRPIKDPNGRILYVVSVVRDITERKHAEKELCDSEERYRAVADFTYDWEYWMGIDGKFVYVSPSCERITGYRTEEFILNTNLLITITHADDRDKIIEHLAIGQKHNTEHGTLEFRIFTRNGEERWIGHECQPVYNPNGEYLGRRGSNRDITEHKRAEKALRESEQRLNAAQRIAKLGDITWNVETGEVVWSDALYDLMQYDKSEKIDLSRVNAEIHHPDDLERVTKWLNDCIASGSDEITPNEYRIIRKDGKILFVHTVGVIHRGKGNQVKVFMTLQDITERKKAEKALRYQNEMRQTILDNIPVMVGFFDREGHYQLINRCWQSTLGWSLEEMLQHKDVFAEFHPDPEYRKYVMDYITRATGSGHWSDFKTRIRDGQILDTSWINVPLSNGSIIGLGIDITERKKQKTQYDMPLQKKKSSSGRFTTG